MSFKKSSDASLTTRSAQGRSSITSTGKSATGNKFRSSFIQKKNSQTLKDMNPDKMPSSNSFLNFNQE